MKSVVSQVEEEKIRYLEETGRNAKYVYLPPILVYQLENELRTKGLVKEVCGLELRFLPGLSGKDSPIVTDKLFNEQN